MKLLNDSGLQHLINKNKQLFDSKADKGDIPTKNSQLENDSQFLVAEDLVDLGGGDMLKAVYDADDDGIVDNAKKVNGFTVESNVPADAKFGDTYNDENNAFLANDPSDGVEPTLPRDCDTVGGFSVGANVPADAKFTDTVYDLSPYLKKRNDTLNTYTEGLVEIDETGVIDLIDGNVFVDKLTNDIEYSIINTKSGVHSFTLFIQIGATARVITFPNNVKWDGGETPEITEVDKMYILTFVTIDEGINWYGMEGGVF